MGQLEKASLLAEKSWHLESNFLQRQLSHAVQWIVPGTFWNHKPQNKCKETNRIKKEKCDFLKETPSGQSCSFQVLLSSLWKISVFPSFFYISCNTFFFLNSLYFLSALLSVLGVQSEAIVGYTYYLCEMGIAKSWLILYYYVQVCRVKTSKPESVKLASTHKTLHYYFFFPFQSESILGKLQIQQYWEPAPLIQ